MPLCHFYNCHSILIEFYDLRIDNIKCPSIANPTNLSKFEREQKEIILATRLIPRTQMSSNVCTNSNTNCTDCCNNENKIAPVFAPFNLRKARDDVIDRGERCSGVHDSLVIGIVESIDHTDTIKGVADNCNPHCATF